jgi:VWFA-related protein
VVRAAVNEVLVPVVVRDAQGRAVGNLTKENFQVFDNGKPQAITGFLLVKREGDNAGGVESTSAANGAVVAQRPLSPSQRFVVFVFDDVNLSSSELAQSQQAAIKMLQTTLPSSDMVAVLSTSGSNSGLTHDRAKLQQAIQNLKMQTMYQPRQHDCPNVDYYMGELILDRNDGGAVSTATEEAKTCASLQDAGAAASTVLAQLVNEGAQRAVAMGEQDYRNNLRFLRLIVSKMAALPGQRTLILISPGFLTNSVEARGLKSQVLDIAARGNVTISAIGARGVTRQISMPAERPLAAWAC